jgi:hypothetical protein
VGSPDLSKAFLDYVRVVQDEDKRYRDSVESFFTKITYILGVTGGLLVVVMGAAGLRSNKEIKVWVKTIAEKQIESKMAELEKRIEASLQSARKLEGELSAKQQSIDEKTAQFEERLRNIAQKVNSDIIYLFVEEREWPILKMLADGKPDRYSLEAQPALRDILRRLRDRLELIKMQPKPDRGNYTVGEMPREGDLKKYCRLTEKGQSFVGIKLKEEQEGEKGEGG